MPTPEDTFEKTWAALGEQIKDKLAKDTWLNVYISKDGNQQQSWCLHAKDNGFTLRRT